MSRVFRGDPTNGRWPSRRDWRHPPDLRGLDVEQLRRDDPAVRCAFCGRLALDPVHLPPPLWPWMLLLAAVVLWLLWLVLRP